MITKWDADGTQLWSRLIGTDNIEESVAVAADGFGNAYIGGQTWGDLAAENAGLSDAFLSKYDVAGNLQWTRQFGTTSGDDIRGISLDRLGNVYVAGWVAGPLAGPHAGGRDALVAKFDSAGNLLWNYQFGTELNDDASGVSVDIWGNVFVSGTTSGSLFGPNPDGGSGLDDTFLVTLDASGHVIWGRQIGVHEDDFGMDVSADSLGNIFYSGWTESNLGGTSAGDDDAFVVKFRYVPEPSAMVPALVAAVILPAALTRRGLLVRRGIRTLPRGQQRGESVTILATTTVRRIDSLPDG